METKVKAAELRAAMKVLAPVLAEARLAPTAGSLLVEAVAEPAPGLRVTADSGETRATYIVAANEVTEGEARVSAVEFRQALTGLKGTVRFSGRGCRLLGEYGTEIPLAVTERGGFPGAPEELAHDSASVSDLLRGLRFVAPFAASPKDHPALSCVQWDAGRLVTTDRYRLAAVETGVIPPSGATLIPPAAVKALAAAPDADGTVGAARSGETDLVSVRAGRAVVHFRAADADYPNVDMILRSAEGERIAYLPVEELANVLRAVRLPKSAVDRFGQRVHIGVSDGIKSVSARANGDEKVLPSVRVIPGSEHEWDVSLNLPYVQSVLKAFASIGAREVTASGTTDLRPVVFRDRHHPEGSLALVMPVREG